MNKLKKAINKVSSRMKEIFIPDEMPFIQIKKLNEEIENHNHNINLNLIDSDYRKQIISLLECRKLDIQNKTERS
jgi:hypothetical protein